MSTDGAANTGTNFDITTALTKVLGPLATAEFGPLGGLVVQLGVPAAAAAIAKHRQRASMAELSGEEVQAAAAELLAKATTFEESVRAGEQAVEQDDGA